MDINMLKINNKIFTNIEIFIYLFKCDNIKRSNHYYITFKFL